MSFRRQVHKKNVKNRVAKEDPKVNSGVIEPEELVLGREGFLR